ncbi:MAG: hypothetical protein ACHQUC_03925, partial [Chlamydiales bacterium]
EQVYGPLPDVFGDEVDETPSPPLTPRSKELIENFFTDLQEPLPTFPLSNPAPLSAKRVAPASGRLDFQGFLKRPRLHPVPVKPHLSDPVVQATSPLSSSSLSAKPIKNDIAYLREIGVPAPIICTAIMNNSYTVLARQHFNLEVLYLSKNVGLSEPLINEILQIRSIRLEVSRYLKSHTTYLNMKHGFANCQLGGRKLSIHPALAGFPPLSCANLKQILLLACHILRINGNKPTNFLGHLQKGMLGHFIAYVNNEGKPSLYKWSGSLNPQGASVSDFVEDVLLQPIVEMATGEIAALKTINKSLSLERQTTVLNHLSKEIKLFQRLQGLVGRVDGLPPPPLHVLLPGLNVWGVVEDFYNGNLKSLKFHELDRDTKIQLLQQFANIIKVIQLLNHTAQIAHRNINRRTILYKRNPDNSLQLRLVAFERSITYEELRAQRVLHTQGNFRPIDLLLLKRKIQGMELYAIGKTLKKLMGKIFDLKMKDQREMARREGLHTEFYAKLEKLIVSMMVDDLNQRLRLEEAEPVLRQILSE